MGLFGAVWHGYFAIRDQKRQWLGYTIAQYNPQSEKINPKQLQKTTFKPTRVAQNPYNNSIHKTMKYDNIHPTSDLNSRARSSFVQKVYSILSIQLTITAAFVLLNIYSTTFAYIQYRYTVLSWVMIAVTFVSLLALMMSPRLCQTYPTNIALLGAFTLGESYLVSSICGMYTPESVLLAAVATAAATFGITFYALTTKSDFTQWMNSFYAFASGLFWVFLFLTMFNVFVFRSPFVSNLMAFVVAAIYCGYILVDTQLILGGKNKELSLDNHILGAVILYVDIIGLFLKLLQLLGDKKEKKK